MKLISFKVQNFRSVNNSGPISVDSNTALVGRNESGKSNLLLALHSLNPDGGIKELEPIKNFPRDRRIEECDENTEVLDTKWLLSEEEQNELVTTFPRAKGVEQISVGRRYSTTRYIGFINLQRHSFDREAHNKLAKKMVALGEVEIGKIQVEEGVSESLKASLTSLIVGDQETLLDWSKRALGEPNSARKILVANSIENEKLDQFIDDTEQSIESIDDSEQVAAARKWVLKNLPKFVYVDEYPDIDGHHNLVDYQQRKTQGNPSHSDLGFEKLCKVAGIDPVKLIELSNDPETRNQLVNRAGAVITKEIRRLWKDRALKIRFNIDGNYFDTYISDPNAVYEVEVNLNERSRGFKWFFSFYVTFCADTNGGEAKDAVLLLDEPGLFLHAKSQSDLLNHLRDDFDNQILFTTHSPFMIPTAQLTDVKTVNIDQDRGTTVTNDPTGDSTTLFPLQAALGYEISQSLFIGSHNLIVEGVTDYWYLSAISDYLISIGKKGLEPNITITPAGGAQKIPYLVSLLASQNLNVVVLMDKERDSAATRDEMVGGKLLHQKNILLVSEVIDEDVSEADIEDLFDVDVYIRLTEDAYKEQLTESLVWNDNIPRVAKQAESALRSTKKKVAFIKAKPARSFLNLMKSDPSSILSASAISRFENLFGLINGRIKNASRNKP